MAEYQGHIEVFGVIVGAFCSADIGGGNHQVGKVELFDVGQEHSRGVEVVYGDVEEALDLVGVEIHGDDTVYTGSHKQGADKLGGDRHTGLVLAVLTGPAEVRNNSNDRFGRSTLGRVDHQQQFHKVVAIGESGLHEVDLAATD